MPRSGSHLQPRDYLFLRGLFESRLMTLRQAAALYFEDRYPSAKRRVARLKKHRLINCKPRRTYQPSLLYLTQRGFEVALRAGYLAEFPGLSWKSLQRRIQIQERTLEHELAVLDVKVAFVRAARAIPNLEITEFTTWPRLCQFHARRPVEQGDYNFGTRIVTKDALLRPDGFIRLAVNSRESFFYLELDRSTESQNTLLSKAVGYRDHYLSGGLAERFGAHRSRFKDYPFRVLVVTKNKERRNNLVERLLNHSPPIKGMVCTTTLDDLISQPFDSIWATPMGYLRAQGPPASDSKIWRTLTRPIKMVSLITDR